MSSPPLRTVSTAGRLLGARTIAESDEVDEIVMVFLLPLALPVSPPRSLWVAVAARIDAIHPSHSDDR
ncbi:hypothetical protein [Frondihabitans australicus]|uniref:Uncharacterized protein n=1 Tax=Frondihabitans australicus TaxID=386892 RepID=A0A495ICG3_9MICO|nr:hypothetical protein [Frondihabitans australicus]RKR73330.1 hypothetical protein C8E83_0422 [Frondihabitans australicus]